MEKDSDDTAAQRRGECPQRAAADCKENSVENSYVLTELSVDLARIVVVVEPGAIQSER